MGTVGMQTVVKYEGAVLSTPAPVTSDSSRLPMIPQRTCSVPDCETPRKSGGYCNTHYQRMLRLGTTELPPPTSLVERFMDKVTVTEGCWLFHPFNKANGYAWIAIGGGKKRGCQRVSYELFIGPIPDGLHIDHLCRVHNCVNPDHLEAVTPRENVLRGISLWASNVRKTLCPQGHPYSGDNLIVRGKSRYCRICVRKLDAARWHRRKARAKKG